MLNNIILKICEKNLKLLSVSILNGFPTILSASKGNKALICFSKNIFIENENIRIFFKNKTLISSIKMAKTFLCKFLNSNNEYFLFFQ